MTDDNEDTALVAPEFPEELYVTEYRENEATSWFNAHQDINEVDTSGAHCGRLAVYRRVREGSLKYKPGVNVFTPDKGKK